MLKYYGEFHPINVFFLDNNFTIVTALYDIDRAKWPTIKRSMAEYFAYFKHLLALNNNVFVFTDQDSVTDYVLRQRKYRRSQTYLKIFPFNELEFYVYIDRIREIMQSNTFRANNSNLIFPEAYSAEYVLLTWTKISFMITAATENPFGSTHFIWLDAGYGHGKVQYPETWVPTSNIAVEKKVTWIALDNPATFYTLKDKHKIRIQPVFNAGLFCGDLETLKEFGTLFKETAVAMMDSGIADDEQAVVLEMYFKYPYIFNIFYGGWYDGFKLFHQQYIL